MSILKIIYWASAIGWAFMAIMSAMNFECIPKWIIITAFIFLSIDNLWSLIVYNHMEEEEKP